MIIIFGLVMKIAKFIYRLLYIDTMFERLQFIYFYIEDQVHQLRDAMLEIRLENLRIREEIRDLRQDIKMIKEIIGISAKTRTRRAKRNLHGT